MKIKNKNFQIQPSILELKEHVRTIIKFFFMTMLFFLDQTAQCQSNQELFLQGNNYFLKGNFNKACDCYEQISEKNSAVWHNMGNCFFNEKNNIQAIICWKRAERNASFRELGKLFNSQSKAFEQMHLSYDGFVMQKIKQVCMIVSVIQLKILLLVFLLLFLYVCYYCFLQSKRLSCKKRYIIGLLLGIMSMVFALYLKEKWLHKKEAIIIHEKVPVYIGPEVTFSQKTILPLGCVVEVLEEKQGMIKIIYPQVCGWVSSQNVEIL